MPYKLSATLKGHTQDVRDVVSLNDDKIASVSRDGTLRVWQKSQEDGESWSDKIVYSGDEFLNSVSYEFSKDLIYFGGKSGLVNGKISDATLDSDPIVTLIGHEGNVCSLEVKSGDEDRIASGSWDKTALIWENGTPRWKLAGHTASVWDVKFLAKKDQFITASADRTIKIWNQSEVVKTFDSIHNDVVRKLVVLNDGESFVSASNDSTIKLCNIESGKVLNEFIGHESFVYDLKTNYNNELISCGEDRTVRIWSMTGEPKQVILLPAISIWCVDVMPNGDIVVGSSDNCIRIFTRDLGRIASEEEIKLFEEQVTSSSISAETMDFDESKLSPPEVLTKPGKKEGQLVVVKSATGVVEAHQFSAGSWSKVGDVVGSSNASGDKKVAFEGKSYDYVFDVDIKDGEPPLKLPFNANDNPYVVADAFIARHELSPDYKNEIVNFILTNTGATTITQNQNPPPTPKQTNYNLLPVKEYLTIMNYNPDSIFNGIVKLNQKEQTFEDDLLAEIGAALQDTENGWELLQSVAETIRSNWETKTPAYDITRLIVHKLQNSTDISDYIQEGLGNNNILLAMLTNRILVNCFQNKLWGLDLMSSESVKNSIFETLQVSYPDAKPQHSANLAISVSTLLFNFSALIINHPENQDALHIIADALNTKFGPLQQFQDSEEASYRLLVSYGNLSTVEPTLRQFAASLSWLNKIKTRYGHVTRFNTFFQDLNQ